MAAVIRKIVGGYFEILLLQTRGPPGGSSRWYAIEVIWEHLQ